MEKKKMKLWKKTLLILAIIILLLVIAFISYKLYLKIDMEMRFNEFEKRQAIQTKGTLSYVEDESYSKVENMDYITQDEIGVKVDSISITDNTFSAYINVKLNKEFDYRTFGYGYVVYDENKNIYYIFSRYHLGENEKYDYNSIFINREFESDKNKDIYGTYLGDSTGIGNESVNEDTIINKMTIEAKDKFPLSKKIYIKIFDLGYFTTSKDENGENIAKNTNLSDAKWLFEFDIPEEMNKRDTKRLKIDGRIEGLTAKNITLTETRLVLNFDSEEYLNLISSGKDMKSDEFMEKCKEMLYITNEEGKVYQEISGGTTGEKNGYKISFRMTKEDMNKRLFINFKVGDKQYKRELIEE